MCVMYWTRGPLSQAIQPLYYQGENLGHMVGYKSGLFPRKESHLRYVFCSISLLNPNNTRFQVSW